MNLLKPLVVLSLLCGVPLKTFAEPRGCQEQAAAVEGVSIAATWAIRDLDELVILANPQDRSFSDRLLFVMFRGGYLANSFSAELRQEIDRRGSKGPYVGIANSAGRIFETIPLSMGCTERYARDNQAFAAARQQYSRALREAAPVIHKLIPGFCELRSAYAEQWHARRQRDIEILRAFLTEGRDLGINSLSQLWQPRVRQVIGNDILFYGRDLRYLQEYISCDSSISAREEETEKLRRDVLVPLMDQYLAMSPQQRRRIVIESSIPGSVQGECRRVFIEMREILEVLAGWNESNYLQRTSNQVNFFDAAERLINDFNRRNNPLFTSCPDLPLSRSALDIRFAAYLSALRR